MVVDGVLVRLGGGKLTLVTFCYGAAGVVLGEWDVEAEKDPSTHYREGYDDALADVRDAINRVDDDRTGGGVDEEPDPFNDRGDY